MTRVFLAYAVSGFVSLGYQVAWFRVFTDWFGSTNTTFALVVANFIGGLAVGSLASRRTTAALARLPGRWDGLRVYGLVELLVALSITATFAAAGLPADLWGSFPYVLQNGIWEQTTGYRVAQAVLAAACVFVPCFFMGVTFPLLCDRFRNHARGARFPAALYAFNTLGACLGVLACQFVFLPRVGHDATLAWLAAANAALGLVFLLARSDFGILSTAPPAAPPPGRLAPSSPMALLALVTLGGFLAGALEGDLFKRISFVIEVNPGASMSFISFWAVLAIFLASATVQRVGELRLGAIQLAFVAAAAYAFVSWLAIDSLRDFVELSVVPVPVEIDRNLEGMRNLTFPTSLVQLLVFTGILVFPPYYAVSLLLPSVCNQLQGDQRHLGLAYGLNTLAFCTGFLAFMLFVPKVNIFYSFKLFSLLFGLCAGWLLLLRHTRSLAAWKPALLTAAVVVAALLVPADFDRSFFREGSLPATQPVRAVKSDGANTTFVVDVFGAPRLFFGRLQMTASNVRARTYMRLMAHFPLLLHPDPKRALLICLGVGNTGSAIASHPSIEQLDIVDLNARVFETAPELTEVHGGLHRDPRVRFIHDDGRNFLQLTDQRYDLITSEPPPPLAAGVYRLYSREYYREARAHLTPNGFMTQWLPLFLMTPESVAMTVSTFLDVFPHAFLFTGFGTDYILVGSPAPMDLAAIESRLRDVPAVADDLRRYNIQTPESLLARIVQGDPALRRNYGGAPKIRDQHNDLEAQFLDPASRAVVAYDPGYIPAVQLQGAPALGAEVAAILGHLGRLRYHVQGYPFETLATVDPSQHPDVALADVDWMAIAALSQQNSAALRAGDTRRSIQILEEILALAPEQPELLILLAQNRIQRGKLAEAIALLEAFAELEPTDLLGNGMLASVHARNGQPRRAAEVLEAVLRRLPPSRLRERQDLEREIARYRSPRAS